VLCGKGVITNLRSATTLDARHSSRRSCMAIFVLSQEVFASLTHRSVSGKPSRR
jgi:hypothetical protein